MEDFAYPLAAIRDDGETVIAETPDQAARFNHLRPGSKHAQAYTRYDGSLGFIRHEWIVRDADGRTVLHEDLPRAPRGPGWYGRRMAAAQEAADKGLPIPGTGKRRRYSSGYRSFRVNTSMRAAEAGLDGDLEDWGVAHMRVGRTRRKDLPQVWDDVAYRWKRRSWKETRVNQWR